MKLINPKQDFEVVLNEVLSSKILSNSNQKILLLVLLANHKKYNMKHYSFTLSEELCNVLNVSNPTFRKDRQVLEDLNLIYIKVKRFGRMENVPKNNRKHLNLYYYFNWQKLSEIGFIELKKGYHDVFNIGEEITIENMKRLIDDKYYNLIYYYLDKDKKRIDNSVKKTQLGKEVKGSIRGKKSFAGFEPPIFYEITYHGIFKAKEKFTDY